jgi:hypothetical protein
MKNMKLILTAVIIILIAASCDRSVTPQQAASTHYSHCRDMR